MRSSRLILARWPSSHITLDVSEQSVTGLMSSPFRSRAVLFPYRVNPFMERPHSHYDAFAELHFAGILSYLREQVVL